MRRSRFHEQAGFKRTCRRDVEYALLAPQKKSGIKESVLTRLVESGEDEDLVRNIAATMYAGEVGVLEY